MQRMRLIIAGAARFVADQAQRRDSARRASWLDALHIVMIRPSRKMSDPEIESNKRAGAVICSRG
jgi:hypothetical protein